MNPNETTNRLGIPVHTVRDLSDLTPALVGLEGWRVEVLDNYGDTRRFYVSRSTGWRPIHIEVKTRRSFGGSGADKSYQRITKLYRRDSR